MKKTKDGMKKRIDTFKVIMRRNSGDQKIKDYCERAIERLRKENQDEA